MLGMLVCFCWRIYLLSIERQEKKEAARNAQDRLSQLETVTADFKGQSLKEKLQDNMQFRQNPLVSDLIKDVGTLFLLQTKYLHSRKLSKDLKEIRPSKKKSNGCSSKRSESTLRKSLLSRMRSRLWAQIDTTERSGFYTSLNDNKTHIRL